VTSGTTRKASHGNGLLLVDDILEESEGALQFHTVDGLGGLAGILEASAQVRAPGAGTLCCGNRLICVSDLERMGLRCQRFLFL
jgi:hypothetical protein